MLEQPKRIGQQSDSDKIVAYLIHKEEGATLSAQLKEKLERLYVVDDLIRQYGSRNKVVPILRERYNYSRATAYRDYEDATVIFGTTSKRSRAYWLDLLMEKSMENAAKADEAGDFMVVDACHKTMAKLIGMMEEPTNDAYEKLQAPNVIIGFFPDRVMADKTMDPAELERKAAALVRKRKQKEVEDIDYEETD